MNRRSIVWGLALGAVAVVGVVGAHRVALAEGGETETGESLRASGWAGPQRWIVDAVDAVELRDSQRAELAQWKADLAAEAAPVAAAHDRVLAAVATSIEAGVVDHATLDPLLAALGASAEANRPAFESAATRLHGLLDASQREQLVANLHRKVFGAHHLHALVGHDHLAAVGAQLGLTDEQIQTIREKIQAVRASEPAPDVADEHTQLGRLRQMKAIGDAFVSDSFDAHTLGAFDHAAMMPVVARRILAGLEAALPVLTPAQRTELAGLIRSGQIAALVH